MRVAKEAWPLVLPTLLVSLVAAGLGWLLTAGVFLLLALLILCFFRDPRRSWEGPEEIVLAAADGRITAIDRIVDPEIGDQEVQRVVTFLSVFNVHVQRCPVEGEVVRSSKRSGRKVAAFDPAAGEVNESHLTVLQRREGELVGVRQIVGLIARRIVPYLGPGDRVARGDHFGVIQFGSRVDLLVPATYEIMVRVGQNVRSGETPMAMPTDPSTNPATAPAAAESENSP